MLAFVQKFKKVIAAVLAVSVIGGVVYFDTYPTYFKPTGVLSEKECYSVAMLVAVSALKAQGQPAPEAAKKELEDVTRIAKRVATYIVNKNPQITEMNPAFLYQQLLQSCLYSGGVYDLVGE